MSEAKEAYYKMKKEIDRYNEGFVDPINDYVTELEKANNKLVALIQEKIDECLELRIQIKELIETFSDLLNEAMYLYQYDPNSFRKSAVEYFKEENELLNKYKTEK